jgi:hypothetical protein
VTKKFCLTILHRSPGQTSPDPVLTHFAHLKGAAAPVPSNRCESSGF